MMKFLLVEDDPDKAQRLLDFVQQEFRGAHVDIVKSFHSALKAINDRSLQYDVALLDMSMPNFDVSASEPSGGTPENFAGRELLAQMRLRKRTIPTVIVTMFDGFGDGPSRVSLADLDASLSAKYSEFYIGHVYYDQAQESWKAALRKVLQRVTK
jgi:CheY-like chemotaxis protein